MGSERHRPGRKEQRPPPGECSGSATRSRRDVVRVLAFFVLCLCECSIIAIGEEPAWAGHQSGSHRRPETHEPGARRDALLSLFPTSEALSTLLTALQDRDEGVRAAAASALGRFDAEEAQAALRSALWDHSPLVRQTAAFALGQRKDRRAVPALREATRDREASVRAAVAWALGEIGDLSAEADIIRLLRDRDALVRREAARSLGRLQSPRAVPALSQALLTDGEAEVRRQAAWALGLIGDAAALTALGEATRAPDPYLSRAAFDAIKQITHHRSGQTIRPGRRPLRVTKK
ncbi:MAG TPA: HEAT repeat domain-containing protein [Blastocatellia bacterium]|nr:HEAT repeat domain-containing protein [Blastocatellia bacterium]